MTYQPKSTEWIALDREKSATAASTALYNTAAKKGMKVANLGQGREITEYSRLQWYIRWEMAKELVFGKFISSKYNDLAEKLNARSADWLHDIMGIGTAKDTTFALQMLGRKGLDESFRAVSQMCGFEVKGKKVLMPGSSWPMVGDLLGDHGLGFAFYEMERGKYAQNIRTQLANDPDIAAVYVNSPHNPTGQILTQKDFEEIFAVLNEFNSGAKLAARGGRKIGLVMDNPYPHACPETKDGRRLDTGFGPFTQNQITPWIMPVSASKFFGMADPGFTMIASHPDFAKLIKGRLTSRTDALAYSQPIFRALFKALAPKSYASVLKHFAKLREKYKQNRASLMKLLGRAVADGDPGMTALVTLDSRDFIGQTMRKHDGSKFEIKDLNDVVEYLANKHGVVVVNNIDKRTGEWRIRLAASAKPADYAEGVARVVAGLKEICPSRDFTPVAQTPQQQPHPSA